MRFLLAIVLVFFGVGSAAAGPRVTRTSSPQLPTASAAGKRSVSPERVRPRAAGQTNLTGSKLRGSANRAHAQQWASFKEFMLSNPQALKMFNLSASGANLMENRAIAAGRALRGALTRQANSNDKTPQVFQGGGVLYGKAIFINSFFNSMQKRLTGTISRWKDKQPWLRWDAKNKTYVHSTTGATSHILSTLGSHVRLHRGASAIEAALWRGTQAFYRGTISADHAKQLGVTLQSIAAKWNLTPHAVARLNKLIKNGLSSKSLAKAERRKTALFLLGLISQRGEHSDGYGAISTTPSLAAATGWVKGTETGRILGREKQRAEVIRFDLYGHKLSAKAREGLYAGVEGGSFIGVSAYVELLFITPAAKLHALETFVAGS